MKSDKQQYIALEARVVSMAAATLLCLSGVRSGNGIGYGGVDANGEQEADTRQCLFAWDYSEWMEEE